MDAWIEHVQRFVVSGCKINSAFESAKTECQNTQYRQLLESWPIRSAQDYNNAQELVQTLEEEVPRIIILVLLNMEVVFAIHPEELSREYEPTAQSIWNWVQQAERDGGIRQDGLANDEKEELRRLRREVRVLRDA